MNTEVVIPLLQSDLVLVVSGSPETHHPARELHTFWRLIGCFPRSAAPIWPTGKMPDLGGGRYIKRIDGRYFGEFFGVSSRPNNCCARELDYMYPVKHGDAQPALADAGVPIEYTSIANLRLNSPTT